MSVDNKENYKLICCHSHQKAPQKVVHLAATKEGLEEIKKLNHKEELVRLFAEIKASGWARVWSTGCTCGTGDHFTHSNIVSVESNDQYELECGTYGTLEAGEWFLERPATLEWLDRSRTLFY